MNEMMRKTVPVTRTADPTLFKAVASHWASGVAVITAADDDGALYGLTMSAVMSLSLDPMQYLISVDRRSSTLPVIRKTGHFCINFLHRSQADLGMKLASKAPDKFADVTHRLSPFGPPILDGAIAAITCSVDVVHVGGDHDIVVGNVLDIEHPGGEPLVYFMRGFHGLVPTS